MENKPKYYYVRSKNLAQAIQFVASIPYLIFDDRDNPEIKKYGFENTERFQKALTEITELRNKFL